MEIVIKIPNDMIKSLEQGNFGAKYNIYDLVGYLMNGTPLPKGHGRLIDADKLKLTQHDIHVEAINYRHRCISIENIDNAPTIIEADKEG